MVLKAGSFKACKAEASCNLFCNSSVSCLFFSTSSFEDVVDEMLSVAINKATEKSVKRHCVFQINSHLNPKQLEKKHMTLIYLNAPHKIIQHHFHHCPWPVMSQFLAVSFPILRFSVFAAPFLPSKCSHATTAAN